MILRLLAKYRRTVVLASTVLFSFFLMTMEVRREEHVAPFLEGLFLEMVRPFLKLSTSVQQTAQETWNNYVDLRSVRHENLRLHEEVQALRARLRTLEDLHGENQRLKNLLGLRERESVNVVPAAVIGKDPTNWFHTLLVDEGANRGIERHMAVIAPGGLVGQVVDVSSSSARIQLITDSVSSVGVLLQASRVTGLLVGAQTGRLRIRYLPIRAEVRVGDVVNTSGLGGVYPKGILVGKVVAVDRQSGALFQEALVEASVDFSQLEEVLVVTGEGSRPPHSRRSDE